MSGKNQKLAVTGGDAQTEPAPHRNINGSKRAEAAPGVVENGFRSVFEGATEGIYRTTPAGRFVLANPTLARMLGYSSPQELIAGVTDVARQVNTEPDLRAEFKRRMEQDGEVRAFEFQVRRKDGQTIWVSENAHTVRDDNGAVLYYEGTIEDIHARKQMELMSNRLAAIVESSEDAIIGKDLDGIITSWNNGATRIFGYSAGEMVGTSVSRLMPAERHDEERQILEKIRQGESVKHFETVRQTKDGRLIDVSVTASPIRDVTGKIIGVSKVARDITEHRRTEDKLKLTRALIENLADAIHVVDPATARFLDVNEQACRSLGYTREEHLALTVFDVTVGIDRALFDETIARARKAGPLTVEARHRRKDGSTYPVEVSLTPVTLDHSPRGVCGATSATTPWTTTPRGEYLVVIVRDITERKRAEEKLKENEAKLRALFEGSIYAMGLAKDGITIMVNPAYAKLFGYSKPSEMAGIPIINDIAPEERPRLQEFVSLRSKGEPAPAFYETRGIRRDGSVFDMAVAVSVYELNGEIYTIGILRDITERKLAGQFQARLATAVEQAAETIVITDICGTILYANPAFEKTTGYTRAEAFGQNPRLLKSGKQDAEFYRRLWETIARGEIWSGHFINRRKDGVLYEEEATISPVRDAAGVIVNYVAVKRNVTREKQLEAQMHQAQKMEAIGQLASGVAHDFNNILGVIIGYSDLLISDLDPDSPLRNFVEEIQAAAGRAAGLTRQLLLFSRKQNVKPVVLDLNDTVKDLDKMLRRLIGENIEMTVAPGEDVGHILADPGHIGQVLMNLVVNARDAMHDSGRLTIVTRNVTLDESRAPAGCGVVPGRYVMLSVSDTGIGMTPEVRARLFEALFTTKPAGKGTGLGLATCQTIVQQSGGCIDVESEAGQGATFKIYFPRVDKPVEAATRPARTGPLPRGKETVLLVEDEPPVRHLAANVLEAQGYTVLRANNGQEALNLVRSHKGLPIRLVVTDIVMPRMGGKMMADWLKTTYPDLKVLFTSGYTDEAIADQGVPGPDVAFLAKPYSPETLTRKVRAMLDNETGPAQLRKQGAAINQPTPGSTENP